MKNGSCPNINFTFSDRFLPPVYILVFVVGLIANGWGVSSLLHNWKKLKIINVFVLNIGLADILYLLTLPALVAYFMSGRKWTFGDALCKTMRFCFNLNLYGSIGFLTCISVYRYLAIVHPVRVMGRFTTTQSVAVSVAVWLLVSVQSLPDMLYVKTSGNATGKCYDTTSSAFVEDYLKYSLGWTLCGFGVPLLVALGCYGHVAVVLCRPNATDKVMKQRSLKLLYILIFLFSVCYVPYHVFKNLNLAARVSAKRGVCRGWFNEVYLGFQVCRGLVCLNSVLNPLIYLHGNDDIPAPLKWLFRRGRRVFGRPTSNTGSVPMTEI
ncbi:P2Y purinoceptor 1-like [Embiotoca jacksoni]|uniref:P2Y purinoceptor 1-like n=1 Tax=Embiotoca jacksoni TaxID=100190 RepID=UPI0037049750